MQIPQEKKELALSLLAAGRSYREVASALDISVGSVHNISRSVAAAELAPLVAEVKKRLSVRYYLLADHMLSRISDMNIASATLKDKVISAAILTDKALAVETKQPLNTLNTTDVPEPADITAKTGGQGEES